MMVSHNPGTEELAALCTAASVTTAGFRPAWSCCRFLPAPRWSRA
jgi:hypothetical protein